MRAAGVVHVAVVEAQVHQVGQAHQHAADGHHHRVRHPRMMQLGMQQPGPEQRQPGDEQRQRAQRPVAPISPEQAEQAEEGHEDHHRLFDAVAQPERQPQRWRQRQQRRQDRAMRRAQQRAGGAEAVEELAGRSGWHDFQQGRRRVME